jgi:parvulin-like peptidyl-prolyl isomerase
VAIVGDQFILYGDVAPQVNQMLEPALAKASSDYERAEIEKYRLPFTQQVVRELVSAKLFYLEFERELEKNAPADKKVEVRRSINKKVREMFELQLEEVRGKLATATKEEVQALLRRETIVTRLALMMKDHNAESMAELDALLRGYGSSLAIQVRQYSEHKLGSETVRKQVNLKPEVTHQEMLDYYRDHAADYAVPAKARFEILTVYFDKFPSRADAYNAIAAMGNDVYFGAPFAAVARKASQEPNAQRTGGSYDWTTQGSLASVPVDQALFALEIGKLSQIIEDDRGLHIVRVIERQPAGAVSFLDAQKAIKEDIINRKRDEEFKAYLTTLKDRTNVWTIYDDPQALARQPSPSAAVPR